MDCENLGIWKQWCMFGHVLYAYSIFGCTGIVVPPSIHF